jgi:hypothetical protein
MGMTEEEMEERIRALARQVNQPPPTPSDRMWKAIAARRAEAKVIPLDRPRNRRILGWMAALAATFLLGIAIDRLVTSPTVEPPNRQAAEPPTVALQVATTQYLSRVETFLTGFRIAEDDTLFRSQARDLLSVTRLLLDRPGIQDPKIKSLLEDLELILVQIVQPGATDRAGERELITDGLQQRQLLPRLRSQIPAGPPHLGVS